MNFGDLFAHPGLLPLVLLAPLAWLLLWVGERARARRVDALLGERTVKLGASLDPERRRLRRALASLALLCATVALAQPRWGEGSGKATPRGVDILVCLDVSRSMLARDVPPSSVVNSRLAAAKAELVSLAERARGDRLGLVVFAGEPRVLVPLTQDAESMLRMAADAGPLSVTRGGTDLGAAIDTARRALGSARGDHEVIVVLTDGEDHAQHGRDAAARCLAQGVRVHCVGFGSVRGSKVAVQGEGGEAFLRDREGADVITAHDRTSLRALAEAGGGEYVDASATNTPLADLYRTRILPMARKAFDAEVRAEREHRFQWPLLAALLLWLLELCLPDRRRRK